MIKEASLGSYWNCFGFDRSAAQIYFAAPPPLSTTLVGKNIASLIFIYLEVAILVGITAALRELRSANSPGIWPIAFVASSTRTRST